MESMERRTFFDAVVFAYAQIFFSNRRWLGLIVLCASFISPVIGIFGLIGALVSTLLAFGLKYNIDRIRSGFYGFNGILFGAASAYYFQITPLTAAVILVFIVIAFFAAAALEHYLATAFNLPGLSLPFILTLCVFIVFSSNFEWMVHASAPREVELAFQVPEAMRFYFESLGYIIFQPHFISGMIIAGAILAFSRVLFVNSIVAYTLNSLLVHVLYPDPTPAFMIQSSFNAMLAAFALGGSLIIVSRKTTLLVALSTIVTLVFTIFFTGIFAVHSLPVLVLPFNVVTLAAIYSLKFRQEHSDLVLLYFLPGSPEENYYYHHNRKLRFDRHRLVFPELPFFGEWTVSQGYDGSVTHRGDWRHALDFVITDNDGKEYTGHGTSPADYYCFNTPVAAPMDGEVVRIVDGLPDAPINSLDLEHNWGNTIVLSHGYELYSSLSHLKAGSMQVKKGDTVRKGQVIARCGSSGRSPAPHLHFQFQLSERVGEKTFAFPISQYLQHDQHDFLLRTFEMPAQGARVRNIEIHNGLRKAFEFRPGEPYHFVCTSGTAVFEETWTVTIDAYNILSIASSGGTTAYLQVREKLMMFTGLVGNHDTALYHFYLCAISAPLGFIEQLQWTDSYPVSAAVPFPVRFLSEFFLVFVNQLSADAEFRMNKLSDGDTQFVISSRQHMRGRGLLRMYNDTKEGSLMIRHDGEITALSVRSKTTTFSAVRKHLELL